MLVLARREGQKIHVRHKGETLTLTVVEDGTLIRLGFDAPRSFEIVRDDANAKQEAGGNKAFHRPDDGEDSR